MDLFINMRQVLAILWSFELFLRINYKVGINYAPFISRINYLSENVLFSKNDEIVTEIYL